jgi:hypothetical protein
LRSFLRGREELAAGFAMDIPVYLKRPPQRRSRARQGDS